MSIEGDASNLRAPAERNMYSKSGSAPFSRFLKPQRGDMCIKTHHPRRSGILPDSKPQRGGMFIDGRHVLAT